MDIKQFVKKREEKIWRTWEGYYGQKIKIQDEQ